MRLNPHVQVLLLLYGLHLTELSHTSRFLLHALYRSALRRYRTTPQKVLAIGDTPLTDAEGARRLGFDFLLVGPEAPRWRDLDHYLTACAATIPEQCGVQPFENLRSTIYTKM